MKKVISMCLGMMLLGSSLSASIQVRDVVFPKMTGFSWQVRSSFSGIWSTDVGYFYMNNWHNDIKIYGSDRYVDAEGVDFFYASLQPFEEKLLPYATPNWKTGGVCTISSERDLLIGKSPVKEIIFDVFLPSGNSEKVTTYLFVKEKFGLFSNSITGYTISFSCSSDTFEDNESEIQSIAKTIYIN